MLKIDAKDVFKLLNVFKYQIWGIFFNIFTKDFNAFIMWMNSHLNCSNDDEV